MKTGGIDGGWAGVWKRGVENWNQHRAGEKGALGSREFWDGFDLWDRYETHIRYPGRLLDAVRERVDAEATVLDIGAGTGSLALPLAAAGKSVTALEPSAAQVERLRRKMNGEGIENITVVCQRWEDAEIETIGRHDVVIASHSLFMMDLPAALRKMLDVAARQVFLVHLGSHDLQRPIREIRGADVAFPNLRVLLKVLEEMGLETRARVFRRRFELPWELQAGMLQYAQGFTPAQTETLRTKLMAASRLHFQRGAEWVRRECRDVLVSLDPRR